MRERIQSEGGETEAASAFADASSSVQGSLVLERVLEYGSLASVRWALDAYGPDRVREFLRARGARTLSRKTLSFWKMLLDLESEPCFETSSLRRSRSFWNY